MFVLYVFIYEVASALEKRSQANAKKVSNLIGISSSAMTNLVINMSKNHEVPQTAALSLASSPNSKNKKNPSAQSSPSKRRTSIDDDPASSMINHINTNTNPNGPDLTNRSSSNETSGEHTPIGVVAPNITNLLALTKVGMDGTKQLDESRTLLPNLQNKCSNATTTATSAAQRKSLGTSNKARKALRTITAIMGAFVLCWTPVSI